MGVSRKESKRRLLAFNWADSMLYEYFKEKIKRQGRIYYELKTVNEVRKIELKKRVHR